MTPAAPVTDLSSHALRAVVDDHFGRSAAAVERFYGANHERVALACAELARRFEAGGRLLVHGTGSDASDADHVAVEFVHPVLVGKRALPALSLASHGLTSRRSGPGTEARPERTLAALARPDDILLVMGAGGLGEAGERVLAEARSLGLLTLALRGGPSDESAAAAVREASGSSPADFDFAVASEDALVVQEVLETLYHVLWELVHVFLEQRGPT